VDFIKENARVLMHQELKSLILSSGALMTMIDINIMIASAIWAIKSLTLEESKIQSAIMVRSMRELSEEFHASAQLMIMNVMSTTS